MAHSKGPHAGDAAKAKGLSKRKLKAATCWAYSKGKCKEPAKCTKLHLGEVVVLTDEQKAAKAAKRKIERKEKGKRKVEAQEADGPKKAKKTCWLCPGCGNKNFGRRAECNGNTCDTPRPEGWKLLKDEDFVGPPLPVKKEKGNSNKKLFSHDDEEDVEGPNVHQARVKANKRSNTFSNHSDNEVDSEGGEESSDE